MIVRDEVSELPDCLSSIADLAHEVCVVDTGSTDHTIEAARGAGAKVSRFDWCDDFSAARNASLKACSGDWIFVLDADERLDGKDFDALQSLLEGPPDRCYRLLTCNYTNNDSLTEFRACRPGDPHGRGYAGWFPSTKVRLFPNREDIRFEGRIHELVNAAAIRAGLSIEDCAVPVHHYPLSQTPERLQAKAALYVALGLERVAASPEDPAGHLALGNQYSELGEHALAAAAYRNCLKHDPRNGPALRDLGSALFLLDRTAEAERSLRLAVSVDPLLPDAWRNLGVVRANAEDWPDAAACFERAVSLRPDWSEGLRHFSVALEHSGRLEEALEASKAAVEANPASQASKDLFSAQKRALGKARSEERRG